MAFFPKVLKPLRSTLLIYTNSDSLAAVAARNSVTLASHVVDRVLQRCEDKAWLHFHDDLCGLSRVNFGIPLPFRLRVNETSSTTCEGNAALTYRAERISERLYSSQGRANVFHRPNLRLRR